MCHWQPKPNLLDNHHNLFLQLQVSIRIVHLPACNLLQQQILFYICISRILEGIVCKFSKLASRYHGTKTQYFNKDVLLKLDYRHPVDSKTQCYIFRTFGQKLQAYIHIVLFLSRIEFERMPH